MGHLKHRGRWLALLLAFTVLPNRLLLVAQTPAAQKPIKVDGKKLVGIENFRDIGGYKTMDGHTIRRNLLYRSGQLNGMTLADNEMLAPLKIRYEIDVRSIGERSNAPTNWGPNPPEVLDIPFNFAPQQQPVNRQDPVQVMESRQRNYANYAIGNAPVIAQVLHDLAQGDEPALLHCTAGQDRTGVTVAVLMTLLGASRKDVYREYLLSADSATEAQQRHMAAVNNRPYPPPSVSPELQKTNGPHSELLDAFFQAIDKQYGSFDVYVRDGLKLSKEDVQNLRRKFLTN